MTGSAEARQLEQGPIVADAMYPIRVFMRLSGLDVRAVRRARRQGLKVRKWGRRNFIKGRDALEYLDSCPEA